MNENGIAHNFGKNIKANYLFCLMRTLETVYFIDYKISFLSYILLTYLRSDIKYKPTRKMIREYKKYYKSFGFRHISTIYLKYIYGITGIFDVRYVPDDIFNAYIDTARYPDREAWQNKAYQPHILEGIRFPETIVKNVNGRFMDEKFCFITEDEALGLIRKEEEIVAKPVIGGGATGIGFYRGEEFDVDELEYLGKDYLYQKVIKQSPLMEQFNSSSVNILKITSFMFHGQFRIVCARIWAAGDGERTSNCGAKNGYLVPVNEDGTLRSEGTNFYGRKVTHTPSGTPFSSIKIDYYDECIDIIKRGHDKLLYFPFISWDFTQNDKGETILIEYNLKWHLLYDMQMLSGPAFGEWTDDVLREAIEARKESKSLYKI